jgi:hypothetical protein
MPEDLGTGSELVPNDARQAKERMSPVLASLSRAGASDDHNGKPSQCSPTQAARDTTGASGTNARRANATA